MKSFSKKTIGLRTHISESVGLGHYSRIENLSYKIKEKKIWLVSGEIKLIKKIFKNKKFFFFRKENTILNFLKKNKIRKIIIDLSYKKNILSNIYKIYNIYKKNKIKTISFDDARQKKYITDISIIPSISGKNKILNKFKKTKFFTGKEFNFTYNKKKNIRPKFKKKIKKVLISISGTDKNNIGFKILKNLIKLNFKFTLINGNKLNFKFKNSIIFKKNLKKIKFYDYISKKQMTREINRTDIGICGPGVIKFDMSSAHKTFILILKKKELNDIQINNFLKFKNCKIIELENIKYISTKFMNYIKDINLRKIHFINSMHFFNYKRTLLKQKLLVSEIKNLD